MTNHSILHNIRILDFTWVLAGPYATRILADFGAEVIKVQPLLSTEAEDNFARGYYNTWNRNKLGIILNLNKPQGVALAKRLAGISDAVNLFRDGQMIELDGTAGIVRFLDDTA